MDAGRAYAGRVTPDNQPDVGKRVVFLHSYSRPHCGALATPHSRGAVRVEAHAAAAHDRGGRRHQQQVEGDADACGGSNQRLMGPGVQCRSAVCKLLNPGGWEPRGQARRWQAASALPGLHACPHLRLLPLLARARPETLHNVGQSVDEGAPEQAAPGGGDGGGGSGGGTTLPGCSLLLCAGTPLKHLPGEPAHLPCRPSRRRRWRLC